MGLHPDFHARGDDVATFGVRMIRIGKQLVLRCRITEVKEREAVQSACVPDLLSNGSVGTLRVGEIVEFNIPVRARQEHDRDRLDFQLPLQNVNMLKRSKVKRVIPRQRAQQRFDLGGHLPVVDQTHVVPFRNRPNDLGETFFKNARPLTGGRPPCVTESRKVLQFPDHTTSVSEVSSRFLRPVTTQVQIVFPDDQDHLLGNRPCCPRIVLQHCGGSIQSRRTVRERDHRNPSLSVIGVLEAGQSVAPVSAMLDEGCEVVAVESSELLKYSCNAFQEAVNGSDISIVCVGTPSTLSGSLDLAYVETVSQQLAGALRRKDAPQARHSCRAFGQAVGLR